MKGLVVVACCQVLGCTAVGVDVWVEPSMAWGAIRAEWLVCQVHHTQLSDGVAFVAEMAGERRVLLIGDDRVPPT